MTLEQAQLELKRLENRLLRERRARAAAEEIAESGMRQLYTRQQHLALLQRITEAANATSSFRDTIEIVLAAVCADGGWDAGHVYYVERRPDPVLISSGLWHSQPHRTFNRLREVSARMELAPGQGLPGRVLQSGETVWVAEIDRDKNCPRRELGVLDAHGAFAFPVLVHDQVVAVFEFFNAEPAPLNMELIALTRPMGVQLGRIFERQAAERAMRDAAEAAQAANKAKSRFLATISHELRTPMNGIIGFAELLGETSLSTQQADYTSIIQRSAQGLLGIINDVLDFSTLDADRLALHDAPYRLRDVVVGVTELMSAEASRKQLALTCDIEEDLPADLIGDADRVRQALLNLAGNAVKFTGSGRVEIRAGRDPDRADQIRISVTDTGPGISEAVQAALFHRFVRGDDALARKHGGTGLGLAITKKLVERMDGAIGVLSQPGLGSTFCFTLPMRVPEGAERSAAGAESADGQTGTVACEPAPAPTASAPRRILLVEDNAVNQRLAQLMLQRLHCVIDIASNGLEAVDRFAGAPYDCIFMDCQMPELDGYGAAERIRQMEPPGRRTPIVALTANAMTSDRDRCLAAGMDDYLTKPVKLQDLARALEQWTPLPRADQAGRAA